MCAIIAPQKSVLTWTVAVLGVLIRAARHNCRVVGCRVRQWRGPGFNHNRGLGLAESWSRSSPQRFRLSPFTPWL